MNCESPLRALLDEERETSEDKKDLPGVPEEMTREGFREHKVMILLRVVSSLFYRFTGTLLDRR